MITSFKEDRSLLEARRLGIDPAARQYGYPVFRVDQQPGPRPIIDATHAYIAAADFVIADLTGGRPNCYYEVGYARALERPLIPLIRHPEKPLFNLSGLPFVVYRDPEDLREQLTSHIYSDVLTTHVKASAGDNAHQFDGHAFVWPYRVTGRVRPDPDVGDEEHTFLVTVRVDSVSRRQPVTGRVTFHMHRDFAYQRESMIASAGYAELYDIPVAEAFTVGVEIADTGVRLELDLSRVPGATPVFRNRQA